MDESKIEELFIAAYEAKRQFPESICTPRIEGFNLTVLPPWDYYEPEDVLRVDITSAAVCCISEGHILLTHMVDENDRWDLPSGGRKPGDSSILDIASREFLEETGIVLDTEIVEPFAYAFREREGINRGGIQYLTFQDIPIPENFKKDDKGRIFFSAYPSAIDSEVDQLVLEPIELFLNKESLLRSPNAWAYRMMYGSLRERFKRIAISRSFKQEIAR